MLAAVSGALVFVTTVLGLCSLFSHNVLFPRAIILSRAQAQHEWEESSLEFSSVNKKRPGAGDLGIGFWLSILLWIFMSQDDMCHVIMILMSSRFCNESAAETWPALIREPWSSHERTTPSLRPLWVLRPLAIWIFDYHYPSKTEHYALTFAIRLSTSTFITQLTSLGHRI